MPVQMKDLLKQYISEIQRLYGAHLHQIILYGSYARGDFTPDSDIDLMILLDLSDSEIKEYGQRLAYMTYDFNLDLDIGPYHTLAVNDTGYLIIFVIILVAYFVTGTLRTKEKLLIYQWRSDNG